LHESQNKVQNLLRSCWTAGLCLLLNIDYETRFCMNWHG
jgi:hypothetical protein